MMEFAYKVLFVCNVVLVIWNGWMLVRNQKLLQQLRRDTRIVTGYRTYYEERVRKEGHNFPFPTPEELEGEEA